mmetsp:Transcript_38183/g.71599  ORF Transcript_38183/g.71599 Transcript_38183/m.71599 type:complete len:333 (-) Transcript_38183:878-1876(-)
MDLVVQLAHHLARCSSFSSPWYSVHIQTAAQAVRPRRHSFMQELADCVSFHFTARQSARSRCQCQSSPCLCKRSLGLVASAKLRHLGQSHTENVLALPKHLELLVCEAWLEAALVAPLVRARGPLHGHDVRQQRPLLLLASGAQSLSAASLGLGGAFATPTARTLPALVTAPLRVLLLHVLLLLRLLFGVPQVRLGQGPGGEGVGLGALLDAAEAVPRGVVQVLAHIHVVARVPHARVLRRRSHRGLAEDDVHLVVVCDAGQKHLAPRVVRLPAGVRLLWQHVPANGELVATLGAVPPDSLHAAHHHLQRVTQEHVARGATVSTARHDEHRP